MDKNFWDASLRPPDHAYANLPDDAGAPPPVSWAMLDVRAYIADSRNATTAHGRMSNGGEIQVTFCVAPPPAVSYFCVWCPDAARLAEIGTEPRIIAAEADLVVLQVGLGPGFRCLDPQSNDTFVYHAAGGGGGGEKKGPSLRLITANEHCCLFFNIGILRHRNDSVPADDDGQYAIVALTPTSLPWQFELHVLDSKTETWSSGLVSVQREHRHGQFRHSARKVVMLGQGGLMGFVDLWRGILVCDVLHPGDLHYLPFPRELKENKKHRQNPVLSRDIVVAQGRIRVVDRFCCSASGAWKASVWSRATASLEKNWWDRDYSFQMHSDLVDSYTMNSELLPKLQADGDGSPQDMLEALYIAHPTLSLDNDHHVYFMAKIDPLDTNAWVLAVDLKNQRIRDVGVFRADRTIDVTLSYIHTRISKYFNAAPGKKVVLKRQGTFLMGRPCKKQAGAQTEDEIMHVQVQNDVLSSMEYEDHMDLD